MPVDPSATSSANRDELALRYLEQLPFAPYPVQEQALFAWFGSDEGVLVCAPTGTGKTLIAEAAAFEALHTGSTIYYTTPLIALTDQKFLEMQAAAERWGFAKEDVGLVTGNRRVNPHAKVLVVVAEILLNRLLQPEADDFSQVSAVVMDEFHSFADPERGIVWEFTLGLLPKHVRLLLLSATVGNAVDFLGWLKAAHKRRLELVQSTDRKVPLAFHWVPDKLLNEQLEIMADGDDETRRTPALLFCFNREECWSVAEELKGRSMLAAGQQKRLTEKLDRHDWSRGAGPKLKQILLRGVGVHHAGLLPRYRRIVEELFQQKLLSVCVCTETLSAGINLPARSVVLPCLIKGPPG
ncbi:MAG: DEAD/DEAH box helicase [Pirellulales bacterium]